MTCGYYTHVSRSDNTPPLRALIYDRVSEDPTGRGLSVASQDIENRRFCERQGWPIVDTIQDGGLSASAWATKERPGFAEVRRRIEAGEVDVLVCWEASRAQRDLEVYLALRKLCAANGVLWAYSGRVYDLSRTDDRFQTGLDALLAEREVSQTRDRIMRGIRTQAAAGAPHGTVPYGYRREYHPVTGALHAQVPDPETAPIVREIVERIIGGDTLYEIVADLNRRGVVTPQARKDAERGLQVERHGWTSSKVRRLVGSTSIIGRRSHHGKLAAANGWEPLVTPAEFALANSILADPVRARHHRGVAVKYLLSGIARCGVCDAPLRPVTIRRRPCYACAGNGENTGKGHVVGGREPMDAIVTAHALRRLADPGFLEQLARPAVDDQAVRAAREVRALEAQLEELVEAVRTRKMSATLAGQIEERIMADLEAARARAVPRWVPPGVADLGGPDATRRWDAASIVQRRITVRTLLEVVLLPADRRAPRRGFDPARLEVTDR